MKSFTAAMLTAALIAPILVTPAAAQMSPQHDNAMSAHPDNHGKQESHPGSQRSTPAKKTGQSAHRFRKGEKFDRKHASHYAEIDYRKYKRLSPPPRGYRYVRSGNDILLVATTSGVIASVVANAFN